MTNERFWQAVDQPVLLQYLAPKFAPADVSIEEGVVVVSNGQRRVTFRPDDSLLHSPFRSVEVGAQIERAIVTDWLAGTGS